MAAYLWRQRGDTAELLFVAFRQKEEQRSQDWKHCSRLEILLFHGSWRSSISTRFSSAFNSTFHSLPGDQGLGRVCMFFPRLRGGSPATPDVCAWGIPNGGVNGWLSLYVGPEGDPAFYPPIMEKQLKDGSTDFQYLHHLHVHFFQKLEHNSTCCVKHLVLIEGIGATVQLKRWHESSDWESKTETNPNMQKQKRTSASRQERILRIEYFKYVKVEWSKTMPSDGPTLHWRWTWSLICEISASLCGYDASSFTAGSRHWNDADSLCTC